MSNREVLPAPFNPNIAHCSPSFTCQLISESTSEPSRRQIMFFKVIIFFTIVLLSFVLMSIITIFHAQSIQKIELSVLRSEEHTSELQSRFDLVCRLLLEKKKKNHISKCIQCMNQ